MTIVHAARLEILFSTLNLIHNIIKKRKKNNNNKRKNNINEEICINL